MTQSMDFPRSEAIVAATNSSLSIMDILSQDLMYLTGVGPKRKEILSKELGVSTYRDLL